MIPRRKTDTEPIKGVFPIFVTFYLYLMCPCPNLWCVFLHYLILERPFKNVTFNTFFFFKLDTVVSRICQQGDGHMQEWKFDPCNLFLKLDFTHSAWVRYTAQQSDIYCWVLEKHPHWFLFLCKNKHGIIGPAVLICWRQHSMTTAFTDRGHVAVETGTLFVNIFSR